MIIDHIGVVIKDIYESKKFYTEVLGGIFDHEVENERVHLVFINFGHGVVELIKRKNEEFSSSKGVVEHIAFTVDSVDDTVKRLKEQKVDLISETAMFVDNKKVFFFQGPNGEKLEIVEYLK